MVDAHEIGPIPSFLMRRPHRESRVERQQCFVRRVEPGGRRCRFPGFCVLRIRCVGSPGRTFCGWLRSASVLRVFSLSDLKVWGIAHHSKELEVRMLSTLGTTPLRGSSEWHFKLALAKEDSSKVCVSELGVESEVLPVPFSGAFRRLTHLPWSATCSTYF